MTFNEYMIKAYSFLTVLVHQLVSVNWSLGWILKLNLHRAKAKATSLEKDTNTLLRPNISEYYMKMNGPSPLRQSHHSVLMISYYLLSLGTAQTQAKLVVTTHTVSGAIYLNRQVGRYIFRGDSAVHTNTTPGRKLLRIPLQK